MTNQTYAGLLRRKGLVGVVLAVLLLAFALASLMAGSAGLTLSQVLSALTGHGTPGQAAIVWNVRLPRVATAIVVGAALALSGAVMQNVLRNPLASASTLGVSQGASFGAAAAIVWLGAGIQVNGSSDAALTITNPAAVTICAFAGGIFTTAVILLLSRLGGVTPSAMVLAGVAISSLFTGATTLIQYFCDDVMVATVVYWTFGSLGRAGWGEIALMAAVVLGVVVYVQLHRWDYNAMESGLPIARSLGVPVDRLVVVSMALAALAAAVSVAFVGCISFVGLIAPHILRKFVGNDYRFLPLCSALAGASLLLGADIVSRMLVPPAVLPIGALTSFLGAPLFLWLIVRRGGFAKGGAV